MKKRAQVTFFIIIGIIIFVVIFSFIFLYPKNEIIKPSSKKNIDPYKIIRECIEKEINNKTSIFSERGLYFEPENFIVYKNKTIAYHCYTEEYNTICERNDAQSKKRIENLLEKEFKQKIEDCFSELKSKNKNLIFDYGQTYFSLELKPEILFLKIRKPMTITYDENNKFSFEMFDFNIKSRLYGFIEISNDIINEEVSCDCPQEECDINFEVFHLKYPDYKISIVKGIEGEKIYNLKDYENKSNLYFAVRNCVKK